MDLLFSSSKQFIKLCLATIFFGGAKKTFLPRVLRKTHYPIVVYYHRVCGRENDLSSREIIISKETFEKQIEFLKNNFNIVPLEAIVDRMKSGAIRFSGDLVITFDDGYIDNYTHAYPILKKHGVPATIFITTDYIGTDRFFWWDRIHRLTREICKRKEGLIEINDHSIPEDFKPLLEQFCKGRSTFTPITDYLKKKGKKVRDDIINRLEERLGLVENQEKKVRQFLSWEEVKEMQNNGITFGSHSHTHPVLTESSDDDVLKELTLSKKMIEEATGTIAWAFAYPDGWFDDRLKDLVMRAGYTCAFQTSRRPIHGKVDLFAIPRKMVKEGHSRGYGNRFSEAVFAAELSGLFDFIFVRELRKKNPYIE
jgi:peptidoglycan/xylan/chitin deacetylase (PgdA/CDA1 family)